MVAPPSKRHQTSSQDTRHQRIETKGHWEKNWRNYIQQQLVYKLIRRQQQMRGFRVTSLASRKTKSTSSSVVLLKVSLQIGTSFIVAKSLCLQDNDIYQYGINQIKVRAMNKKYCHLLRCLVTRLLPIIAGYMDGSVETTPQQGAKRKIPRCELSSSAVTTILVTLKIWQSPRQKKWPWFQPGTLNNHCF